MTFRNDSKAMLARFLAVLAGALAIVACGGSSSTPTPTPTPVANTVTAEVNAGPANNSTNMLFVTVTVCLPGTTTCTDIPNVQVDTMSEGLRVLSTALGTLGSSLPTIQDSSSNVLQECIQFADTTYIWGPVATADVTMAGEKASSVPIQVINNPAAFDVPSSCLTLGNPGPQGNLNTVATLGANGIIGLGNFAQDCGGACTSASSNPPPYYFVCPQNVCSIPAVPLNDQLWNPVALFAADNNGVMITMPAIDPGGATTASGSLIFGVGTQTDNALGSATLYATDTGGDIRSSYGGISYPAFFDTGSTGIYFLDYATLGITECTDTYGNPTGFYCPASPVNYTVTNTDGNGNGTTGSATFTIANADTLFSNGNSSFFAFNDLGGDSGSGPSSDSVDFGMPFFYGRNVFIGIEGTTVPNGVSAPNGYFAY
jgi:hypothetical protein